jgi:hypothetical protein
LSALASGFIRLIGIFVFQYHLKTRNIMSGTTCTCSLNLGSWQPYTPTVTSSVGSFTTLNVTASYQTIGQTVVFQMIIDILAVGSAAGTLIASLPLTTAPGTAFVMPGRETAITGKMCQAYVGGQENNLWINYYDNTSVIANGNRFFISGVYESIQGGNP